MILYTLYFFIFHLERKNNTILCLRSNSIIIQLNVERRFEVCLTERYYLKT